MKYLKVKDIVDIQDELDIHRNTIEKFVKLAILMKLEQNMNEEVKYKITEIDIDNMIQDILSGDFWDIIDNMVEKEIRRFKVKE